MMRSLALLLVAISALAGRAAALTLTALCVSACYATHVRKTTAAERQQLAQAPLDVTVAIVDRPHELTHISPGLVSTNYPGRAPGPSTEIELLLAGAFRSLWLDSAGKSADLVAEPVVMGCPQHLIEVWTTLTLGVFPSVFTDSTCVQVVFRRYGAKASGDSVVVRAGVERRDVMGWVAFPLLLWPGWSRDNRAGTRLLRDAVHLAIYAKREELGRLVATRVP